MPFTISTTRRFSAAHALRLYDGATEPVHGHNFAVTVVVLCHRLDEIGVVMDFHDLERRVDELVAPFHNAHLNDVPAFRELNPTAENIAHTIATRLELPTGVRLESVSVEETPGNWATYRP